MSVSAWSVLSRNIFLDSIGVYILYHFCSVYHQRLRRENLFLSQKYTNSPLQSDVLGESLLNITAVVDSFSSNN